MTQEEKSLLLKDLCARLPYRIIGVYSWKGNPSYNRELTGNLYDELNSSWSSTEDSKFIPYLRPISSMTEEEEKEFNKVVYDSIDTDNISPCVCVANWMYSKYFDVNGLIPKGLALEATEENNPYKE